MHSLKLHLTPLTHPTSLLRDRHREWWHQILDPSSHLVNRWNRVFFVTSLVALFVDPLFFYLLGFRVDRHCLTMDFAWAGVLVTTRTIIDLFSALHIIIKFRTAYVAPTSRVFGRGDLVKDPYKIAVRYLKGDFAIDLAAALPLPQVLGSVWYLMSVERIFSCWKHECRHERGAVTCRIRYLDCDSSGPEYERWYNNTEVFNGCDGKGNNFDFGLFADALNDEVPSANLIEKYFYCLWFGLRSLSSYGQSLSASAYVVETVFGILICLMGLVFFALLIGNVQAKKVTRILSQTYLQSTTARLEEWRVRRRDTEEWMRHRQLPPELQDRVRRFVQYNWLSTRGVKEEDILQALPLDLRREIQKHLCLDLVRRVPFFSQMDEQLLDAICERLVPSLNTKGTYVIREGDPVNEMLFVIRGQLESSTTDGGRSGFYNSITLKPGDFCGEELLTWALLVTASSNLNRPASTRTVRCLTEVEAFALLADDLRFFANQFKRLHSKTLQHAFRYYSHQWRTWGACIVQAAWRRHRRRRAAEELLRHESMSMMINRVSSDDDDDEDDDEDLSERSLMGTLLASKFAANTKKGAGGGGKVRFVEGGESSLRMPKLFKPDEPDF
ncbi:cyclic nucleotide-gated channel 16 [Striga asiatica]|uniref:Cyclic nucleotide-gated channel 16 n=1 Tax=Striga asiatica TaxID=4170 RepID=A0A5A7PBU8_STRAF|nr:cyclic nucleotide-gated channel 16 [Striga asiatica]